MQNYNPVWRDLVLAFACIVCMQRMCKLKWGMKLLFKALIISVDTLISCKSTDKCAANKTTTNHLTHNVSLGSCPLYLFANPAVWINNESLDITAMHAYIILFFHRKVTRQNKLLFLSEHIFDKSSSRLIVIIKKSCNTNQTMECRSATFIY